MQVTMTIGGSPEGGYIVEISDGVTQRVMTGRFDDDKAASEAGVELFKRICDEQDDLDEAEKGGFETVTAIPLDPPPASTNEAPTVPMPPNIIDAPVVSPTVPIGNLPDDLPPAPQTDTPVVFVPSGDQPDVVTDPITGEETPVNQNPAVVNIGQDDLHADAPVAPAIPIDQATGQELPAQFPDDPLHAAPENAVNPETGLPQTLPILGSGDPAPIEAAPGEINAQDRDAATLPIEAVEVAQAQPTSASEAIVDPLPEDNETMDSPPEVQPDDAPESDGGSVSRRRRPV